MHYGLARHFGANVDKHLEEKGNMEDDQVNIKIVNMKQDIASNRAWIEQVSKSEALHAERVIANTLDVTKLKSEVLQLQGCEDLRDQQMLVVQKVIKNIIKYLEKDGKDGEEFKILDIQEAKE